MLAEALEKLISLAQQAQNPKVEVGGKEYSIKRLFDPAHDDGEEPRAVETISVHTLDGFIDGVQHFGDEIDLVAVDKSGIVTAFGKESDDWWRTRDRLVCAQPPRTLVQDFLNSWHSQTNVIIGLQTHFDENDELTRALEIISAVTVEGEVSLEDNGLTQRVTTRSGVRGAAWTAIKNPFLLHPYRTYTELPQPGSKFLLRLQKRGDNVEFLFKEIQAYSWDYRNSKNITEYLKQKLTNMPILG